MAYPSSTAPTVDRIPTVDIVRGFALFGILVVNLTTFRSPNPVWHGIDSAVDWLILVLFQGKFMSLYSFLFGLSFALFIMTTLFYNNGFKLFDRIGPTIGLLLAMVIYTVQVILSNLWFRRFCYGPAEWLWRCLTYGKWIKITIS